MVIELYFELVESGQKVVGLESLFGITDFCFMFQFDVKVYLSIMMGLVKLWSASSSLKNIIATST